MPVLGTRSMRRKTNNQRSRPLSQMTELEELVDAHCHLLYRFAFSLAKDEDQAAELVQRAFLIWIRKGDQLPDQSNPGTGLFTTLYREYLGYTRPSGRSLPDALDDAEPESAPGGPEAEPEVVDAREALDLLSGLDETFRAPLALFYLQQHGYTEIASILDVPIGTVMSRISRGKEQLRRRKLREPAKVDGKVVDFQSGVLKHSNG